MVGVALLLLLPGSTNAATFTVDDSGGADYTRIQDAVNAATPGDTIEVNSGTYYENVNVNKRLILRGIWMPVVDARGARSAITLAVDGIWLEGFAATGSGYFGTGIEVSSNNNTLRGNNASNNFYGIWVYSSNNNTLTANNASNNHNGVYLSSSSNNTLSGNNASNNNYGISLDSSSNNILTNDIMNGNQYNFQLVGYSNSDFDNQIDTTNMVDGKTVYYIKEAADTVYDSSTNAGTFYCINCVNVTLKSLDLKNNAYGILFWNTTRSTIQNANASYNDYGIYLTSSSNNTMGNNNASSSTYYGIYLAYSSNNTLNGNNASNNTYGINLYSSNSNTLISNDASNNLYGISLSYSSNNTLTNNIMKCNKYNFGLWGQSNSHFDNQVDTNNLVDGKTVFYIKDAADSVYDSSTNAGTFYCINCVNVTLKNLDLKNNTYGILFWNTTRSKIQKVNGSNNMVGFSLSSSSNNNTFYNNIFNNTNNVEFFGSSIGTWNTTKTPAKNIIGGSYLGGNFWANPAGTGFSQTCADGNNDGICDSSYTIDSNNIDYLPLARNSVTPSPTPTATPTLDPEVSLYDTNHDGRIQKSEAVQAVVDYFAGNIQKDQAIKVVMAYFDSNNNQASAIILDNVVDANNQFASDLYSKYKSKEGNIFFSPFSISTALAMTYEGAKGKTAEEMQAVLHLPDEKQKIRSDFVSIYNEINKTDKAYMLTTANALWAQKDYPFISNYFSTVDTYYKGKVTNLDFKNETEKSRVTINNWVENQTYNKIKNIIPSGTLTSDTRLVLTNAIYFKANWSNQFDAQNTRDDKFNVNSNVSVNSTMMHQTSYFNYSETSNLQILEMDYLGNNLSMLVILPQENNLNQNENIFNKENLIEWKKNMTGTEVAVTIPKFKFETKYFMAKDLEEMGMPAAFKFPDADFTGMSPTGELYIGEVIHQTFVEVTEYGTEAAAATVVELKAGSAPAPPKIFNADHPFIFLIQQKSTGNILFIGRLTDPSK